MAKSIVYLSFSGGLDSTTLLYKYLAAGRPETQDYEVRPIFFNYGSKHNPHEMKAAKTVLAKCMPGYELPVIDLSNTGIFAHNKSALLAANEAKIPCAGYSEPGSLDATVVPGRNLIMASILSSMAESAALATKETAFIALAIHAGDHALYPDCRSGFAMTLQETIKHGTEGRVMLQTPFVMKSKAEIVHLGYQLGVPFELTRSCYQDETVACGVCGTCRERLKAFWTNQMQDPAPYAAPHPIAGK